MKVTLETSGKMLREKISNQIEGAIFYESGIGQDIPPPGSQVVLFGDFFPAMCELISGGARDIFLWVLCHRARLTLEEFFPELAKSVGVIGREELFSEQVSPETFPDIGSRWEMIFAGRIGPAKNVRFLLHLTSILQCQFKENVTLKLIGTFDQVHNLAPWGEKSTKNYEEEIRQLISDLQWLTPPEIIPGEENWTRHLNPQSVLVAPGIAWAEDFGVAVAQARQLGNPVLISDIGGHADVSGKGVIRIPSHFLVGEGMENFLSSNDAARARAEVVARWLQKRIEIRDKTPGKLVARKISPFALSPELARLHAENIFPEANFKFRGFAFWNELSHRKFWKRYYAHWARSSATVTRVIFLSSWALAWTSMKIALTPLLTYWLSEQNENERVVVLGGDSPAGLESLASEALKQAIFVGFSKKEISLAGFIRNLHPQVRFLTYVLDGPTHFFYPGKFAPEKVLNRRDVFLVNGKPDREMLKLSFPEANCAEVSFFDRPPVEISPWGQREKEVVLFYAGRCSPQKNIHSIILALALTHDQRLRLEIVGEEDSLGSRHLGIENKNYELFLKDLSHSLGISDRVLFRKPIEHRDLLKEASERKLIIVAPSVHVDENFGLFARDGLVSGCPAVLSSWGGLRSFQDYFPESVFSVGVELTEFHLQVSPYHLKSAIEKALAFQGLTSTPDLPPHITFIPEELPGELKPSAALKELRANPYEDFKVFDLTVDRELLKRCRLIYGGVPKKTSGSLLAPWTDILEEFIVVNDPLLTNFRIPRTGERSIRIREMVTGKVHDVSSEEHRLLDQWGQIFSKDEAHG